jgi:hypothetical protein
VSDVPDGHRVIPFFTRQIKNSEQAADHDEAVADEKGAVSSFKLPVLGMHLLTFDLDRNSKIGFASWLLCTLCKREAFIRPLRI